MTLIADVKLSEQQHIVLDDVSWEFYEQLLREIGNRHIRVTYDDGSIEIMAPLERHERWGARMGRLIEAMAVELNIPMTPMGSTTFRHAAKKKGLEPDECYYIQHADAARQMEEAFDPAVDPPPDLAIEIDITRRSIPRQPIYAALGVPELWRYDGERLEVLVLTPQGRYERRESSRAFPFLPMNEFCRFLDRLRNEADTTVMRAFQQWVRTLRQAG